jgi:hypothetical protein
MSESKQNTVPRAVTGKMVAFTKCYTGTSKVLYRYIQSVMQVQAVLYWYIQSVIQVQAECYTGTSGVLYKYKHSVIQVEAECYAGTSRMLYRYKQCYTGKSIVL